MKCNGKKALAFLLAFIMAFSLMSVSALGDYTSKLTLTYNGEAVGSELSISTKCSDFHPSFTILKDGQSVALATGGQPNYGLESTTSAVALIGGTDYAALGARTGGKSTVTVYERASAGSNAQNETVEPAVVEVTVDGGYAILDDAGTMTFFRSVEYYADKTRYENVTIHGTSYSGTVFSGANNESNYNHFEHTTYANASDVPWSDSRNNIQRVVFADQIQPSSTKNWFYFCRNLKSIDFTNLDTSYNTDMNQMFYYCTSLSELVFPDGFSTGKVTDMSDMVGSCSSLIRLDISSFDMTSVERARMLSMNNSLIYLVVGEKFKQAAVSAEFVCAMCAIDSNGNEISEYYSAYTAIPEGAATYKAKTYTVRFDSKGGNSIDDILVRTDQNWIKTQPEPTRDDGAEFMGWYSDEALTNQFKFASKKTDATLVTSDITLYAKWQPVTYTVGGETYESLNEALDHVEGQTAITVPKDVALDDAKTLTVPAGGTVKAESKAVNGAASAKEVTITKTDNTTETAYLVTVGGATSAVKSSAVDNVITGELENGQKITTAAEAKANVAKMFDVPKALAALAAQANVAVNDVDFSMKADDTVTQKSGHTKTFEVYPVAKFGSAEIEVPAEARIAKEYNVTLGFGAANKGKYAKITHYKSDTETEVLGIYPIGADGNVTFPTKSFSPFAGDVLDTPEDGATFTLTVDAPETIDVDTEFAVEVKLTSSVDTKISTMKFSYILPENFAEVSKTGNLAGAVKQTESDWLWDAATGDKAYIELTANTAVSLGTIKAKVAKADAEYNADKTFTFNAAKLTLVNPTNAEGTAYKEYTTSAASDTTKVTTTYAITWNYNGGKLNNAESRTDTVGVNVVPTAPAPVKPGYNLSWSPAVDKAAEATTYTAVWTLNTSGMSVEFNDYGYAYLNGTDYDKLLVLKAPPPESGYAYAIDGNLMFATTEANYRNLVSAAENETVYVYLVDSATTSDNVLKGATPKLSVVEGTNEVIARDGDLNRDGGVKQGDLGVLVDLFKTPGLYNRTGVVGVRARLEADIDNSANAAAGFKSIADVNAIIGKLFPASGG